MTYSEDDSLTYWWASRIILILEALLMWGTAAATQWLLPVWLTIFRIPVHLFLIGVLIAAALLSLLAALAWRISDSHIAAGWRVGIVFWHSRLSLILASLLLIPGAYLMLNALWVGYNLIGLALVLLALLLYLQHPAAGRELSIRQLAGWAAAIVMFALVLRLGFLLMDWMWFDEGFYLSTAQNILNTGRIAPAAIWLPEDVPIHPFYGHLVWLYGAWARVVGLGLYQERALSYIAGLLSLPLIYQSAKLWYGKPSALIATAFSSLSILFLISTYLRPDVFLIVLNSLTLALHIYACQQKRAYLHFCVGLIAGLALEAHLVAIIFLFAYAGYYITEALRQTIRQKQLAGMVPLAMFAAGALIAVMLYYGLRASSLRWLGGGGGGYQSFLYELLSSRLLFVRLRTLTYLGFSLPEVLLITTSIGAAAFRRTAADRHWLILLFFMFIGYVLFGPNSEIHYVLPALPFLFVASGAAIVYGLGQREQGLSLLPRRLAFAAVAVILAARGMSVLRAHARNEFQLTEAAACKEVSLVRNYVSPHEGIIGPASRYPCLPDYTQYLHLYYLDAGTGPELEGVDPEAYWRDRLLETWPVMRIDLPQYSDYWDQVDIGDSYMAARHASEVEPHLWLVAGRDLVPFTEGGSEPASDLALAAYRLPTSMIPGSTINLSTIWVTRADIIHRYEAVFTLVDVEGQAIEIARVPLVSGWAHAETNQWEANQFHDVEFRFSLIEGLEPGDYGLHLHLQGGGECMPRCDADLQTIHVTTNLVEE